MHVDFLEACDGGNGHSRSRVRARLVREGVYEEASRFVLRFGLRRSKELVERVGGVVQLGTLSLEKSDLSHLLRAEDLQATGRTRCRRP